MENLLKEIQENNVKSRRILDRMEQENPINPTYTVELSRKDIDILFNIGDISSDDKVYREYELFDIYSKIHRQIMDSLLDKPQKVV